MNKERTEQLEFILRGPGDGFFELFTEKIGEILRQNRNDEVFGEPSNLSSARAWVEVYREIEDFANFMRKDFEAFVDQKRRTPVAPERSEEK